MKPVQTKKQKARSTISYNHWRITAEYKTLTEEPEWISVTKHCQ
jgi:hypothetical protein